MSVKIKKKILFSTFITNSFIKKNLRKLTLFISILLGFSGCFNSEPTISRLILSQNFLTLTLDIDKTATLSAMVIPRGITSTIVKWSSSDTNVVVVNKGRITAKEEGTAIITAFTVDGNNKAECKVVVTKPHPAEPQLIKVEGGTFLMGCSDEDCYKDGSEIPVHPVRVSSFKIAIYPVTQKQWVTIMGNTHCFFQGDNLPVDFVSWNAAVEFIHKLNELTGKNYRLPTEAEWEFAARGGNQSKGYKYSGSNNIDRIAWYNGNSKGRTYPVGTKKSNELGLFDMSGNVWECCSDRYGAYSDKPQTNPTGVSQGKDRVARGGSCFSNAIDPRVSSRVKCNPNLPYKGTGLRLVLPLN